MNDLFVKLYINTDLKVEDLYDIFFSLGFIKDQKAKRWLNDQDCYLVIDINKDFSIDKASSDFIYYPYTIDIEPISEDRSYINKIVKIVTSLKSNKKIIDVIPVCDFEDEF